MVKKNWSCLYLHFCLKKNILQGLDLLWCTENNVKMYATIFVQGKKTQKKLQGR